jgi:hypothetical protein
MGSTASVAAWGILRSVVMSIPNLQAGREKFVGYFGISHARKILLPVLRPLYV